MRGPSPSWCCHGFRVSNWIIFYFFFLAAPQYVFFVTVKKQLFFWKVKKPPHVNSSEQREKKKKVLVYNTLGNKQRSCTLPIQRAKMVASYGIVEDNDMTKLIWGLTSSSPSQLIDTGCFRATDLKKIDITHRRKMLEKK